MNNQKRYFCYSCNKECNIVIEMEDNSEVYKCSQCKNSFIEEIEDTQNNSNNTNTSNNNNNLNNINIQYINLGNNINNINNNNRNNNANLQYGLNGTLLFLPSTVNYVPFSQGEVVAVPNIFNNFGNLVTNIATPILNSLGFNSSNNPILNFLNNHNNDFQFNNLVNIIMSLEAGANGNPPASQRAIDSLPKITINKENINNYKDITCNICLDGFCDGDIIRILECKHEFHENCIITWLRSKNTCPVCRHELESNDPNYERRKNNHRENLRNLHRNNNNNFNNNNNGRGNGGGSSGGFGTFV